MRVLFGVVDFNLPLFLKSQDVWRGDGTPGPFLIQEEEVLASAGGGGDWSFAQVVSLTQGMTWSVWKLSVSQTPLADLRLEQNGLFEIVEPAVCFHLSLKPSVEFRIDQRDFSLH